VRSARRVLQIGALCLAAILAACAGMTGGPATSARTVHDEPVNPAAKKQYDAALALMRANRLPEAERALKAMGQSYPDLSGPYGNLGIIYFRTNRAKQAIDALNRAISLNPRPVYFNELGIVYRHQGQFDKARDSYQEALAVDPNFAAAQLNLGILYDLYLGKPAQAIEHYKRYQTLQPKADDEVSKWIFDLERQQKKS